ncbi:hypothetical protein NHH03_03660 [Stieleria sp. TO1_6]|uniref:FliG C-terminal domain-containing protein n=1 Tax=Stieleria tagensis TaxID=2956795 RepID=UPI00209B702C|nr:FliG C-terminal domain-containing protein [Stieleria tagensis]MCO8120822.1 hypothetical protein [Stieleria tagensis]
MMQTERPATEFSDQPTSSLRQIAILLHTLPERTHRVLLGQLDQDEKQRIADELLALGEVDAMEQYRVLKSMRDHLHAETRTVESVESEIQDEIMIGRARVSKKRSGSGYRTRDDAQPNPSVTSGPIVSSPASESVSSIAGSATVDAGRQLDPSGGASSSPMTPEMLQIMFTQFHQTQAAGVLPAAARGETWPPAAGNAAASAQTTAPQIDSPNAAWLASPPVAGHDATVRHANSFPRVYPATGDGDRAGGDGDRAAAEAQAAQLARRVDQFLMSLPTADLCQALGMVTTKQAFLVLCGLPNETAELVLEMLPRRKARKVRSDMRRMGQLQLSDIDAAKQVVSEVAIRLTTRPVSFAA